jgi:hypothetical protein
MDNRIIGLDVGATTAIAIAMESFPDNPKQYFSKHRRDFVRIKTNVEGMSKLLALKPTGIVLEPTGSWYSAFWEKLAKLHHIPIYWVGHGDLAAQRGSYGFLNKRDDEDALCLALCYFDPKFINERGEKRFLVWYECDRVINLRSQFHELEQLDKLRTSIVNQIRQRLSYEFPETAKRTIVQSVKLGFSPFLGWLARIHTYTRIENEYKRSVAHNLGISISSYTCAHAAMCVDLELRANAIDHQIAIAIEEPEFIPYLKVFEKFGFGKRLSVLMLMQIYPFEKFLVNGQPLVETEISSKGKKQRRYRSLRSFQLYLGLGYKWKQSGDKTVRFLAGSSICRAHLFMWCFDRIAPLPPKRLPTQIGKILGNKYDKLRRGEVKLAWKDAQVRVLYRATSLLFYELCHHLL